MTAPPAHPGRLLAACCLCAIAWLAVPPAPAAAPESPVRTLEPVRIERLALNDLGTPSFVRGRLGHIALASPGPEAARMVEGLARGWVLPADARFAPVRTRRDGLGQTHVRVQEYIGDLPVVGAEAYVHADPDGEVTLVNGSFAGAPKPQGSVRLSPGEAIGRAVRAAGIGGTMVSEPTLTYVLDAEGRARLAWAAEVEYVDADGPQRDRLFADADDGSVAARHPEHAWLRNRRINTMNHATSGSGTLARAEGQAPVADTVVNHAYDDAGSFYDYYLAKFGRDSFDGAGAALPLRVHYGTNYANAFWDGTALILGDGDGVEYGNLAALDVVAHELTHAVTENESNLIWSGESGGLSEAMSDIFAANIQAWVNGGINADTWKIGEDVATPGVPGDALRYMNDPALDGGSFDYWAAYVGNYDIHYSCGIANLAYYLLVQGGTHPRGKSSILVAGIGMAKAEQILYRAQTTYLVSTSKFKDARNAMVQAALDLYGSFEAHQVSLAWSAVGVPDATTDVGPDGLPAPTAGILAVAPNPLERSTQIRLRLPPSGEAVVSVFDTEGRRVRELSVHGVPAADGSVTWDGRDAAGTRVPSGVYFARVAGAPAGGTVRIAVLR